MSRIDVDVTESSEVRSGRPEPAVECRADRDVARRLVARLPDELGAVEGDLARLGHVLELGDEAPGDALLHRRVL